MSMLELTICQCLLLLLGHFYASGQEPQCNKFAFEEQLLEKMIRLEVKVETMFDSITKSQMEIKDVALTVTKELNLLSKERERIKTDINVHKAETNKKLEDAAKDMSRKVDDFENKILRFSDDLVEFQNKTSVYQREMSVTYIRWERTVCPNTTKLLYEGYASGSHYTHSGGPSDTICLPKEPQHGKHHPGHESCYIYGTEYQDATRTRSIFGQSMGDQDVPCALCEATKKSAILMIPARNECYEGWHLEYAGYLMTEHHTHQRSNMKCVDANPEEITGQGANNDGNLLYFVEVDGTIPDPPYTRDMELTCVVCTK